MEIEFAPVISTPRQKVSQALQYDMDLECHIEAYPPPQIVWTKDSHILRNGNQYKISNFNTADEFTDSTLRIRTVQNYHYGDYMCQAVNKLGKDEGIVTLQESKNPVCPPACGSSFSAAERDEISFISSSIAFLVGYVLNMR